LLVLPLVGEERPSRPEERTDLIARRFRWHGPTWLCWNVYALVCSCWFLRSAVTQNWIEAAIAVLVVSGCIAEKWNCKRRYDRIRSASYLDEPPLELAVSALTPPSTVWAASTDNEWSVDTHDDLGNPLHACSRAEHCPHVRAELKS
jgi:hypothetical protein